MDTMNQIIAANIRKLREENNLSMDALSKLSGVSKSMLAQIERGDGNPTISTLWKLSNGMKVPFDALTLRPKNSYEVVKISEMQPIIENEGKVKNFSIFPDDENRRFAVYYLKLEVGSYFESDSHLKGTTEFITVCTGELEVQAGRECFRIKKEESLKFRADAPHSYKNVGTEPLSLQMILFNP